MEAPGLAEALLDILALSMSLKDMDDAGMYVWAAVLTTLGLGASYFIALGWQRWREGQKKKA